MQGLSFNTVIYSEIGILIYWHATEVLFLQRRLAKGALVQNCTVHGMLFIVLCLFSQINSGF